MSNNTGNTQSMDPTDRLEIYIPVEAEVKIIPLLSLSSSVLRRMGLPLPDTKGSRKLAGSPECTWICPVVVRRKGQKPASHTGNSVVENMSSQLCREFQAAPGPFRMSFVSSNRAAFKVLKEMKDFTPGKKVSTHRSQTSLLSQGLAQQTNQTAVVIYRGRIYLSIRKPRRSQGKQGTRDPQSAARSSIPSTSLPKSQKKELQNVNRPKKKHTTCAVTHSENIVTHKVRDVSSSKTAHSVPQSTESEPEGEQEVVANKDCGECQFQDLGRQEAESTSHHSDMDSNMLIDSGEISNQSCSRRQPLGAACASTSPVKECDFKELAQEEKIARMKAKLRQDEAESTSHNSDMDSNMQVDSSKISNQSCSRRQPLGAACASTSLVKECAFKELAQEEKIAKMKAKLRQDEAAFNLPSS